MTSPDGITWTSRTSAANNSWINVTWGGPAGYQLFVAVAYSGSGNRVMTSADGITWTLRTSAANNSWYGVTWGGPAGSQLFVAVAATGTGNRVMTSPDGITWTSRTSAADNGWTSVTWGGPVGYGVFVAVAYSGTGNRVMTSPDGIAWTLRTSAADNSWLSVTWGGPAGSEVFAAVANSGTGNRVMTSSTIGFAATSGNVSVSGGLTVQGHAIGRGGGGVGGVATNFAAGLGALATITTGGNNTAVGVDALRLTQAGGDNTTFSNCTGLGYDARVSASNQVQLGNAATTTYVYGAVNNRSDARDKADTRDTLLGLEFIEKLRPVDYRWDMRDDYFEQVIRIERIDVETSKITQPGIVTELDAEADTADDPASAIVEPVVEPEPGMYDVIVYDQVTARITYPGGTIELVEPSKEYDSDTLVATCPALPDLVLKVKTRMEMKSLEKDGSKKRNRYHHGLIAQEVETVLQESGIDFGGFQHHSVGGGEDIYTIGYSELFGPLIKAVQQLSAENSLLKNDVATIKAHLGLA